MNETNAENNKNQQIQLLEAQLQQLDYQLKEYETAENEIKKAEGNVYKNAGLYLIEVSKDEALNAIENIKAKGFPDAFIVKFIKGKRVN